jgi:hypothetical protein
MDSSKSTVDSQQLRALETVDCQLLVDSPSAVYHLPYTAFFLLLVVSAGMIQAKEKLLKNERLVLIRELDHEIAVTKVPLPRGKHGVYLDSSGKLDQGKARQELRSQGTGVSAGMPVEITKMTFGGGRILFEINGGGKTGKKWYQRIEVGMGTSTAPIATPQQNAQVAQGSYVTLEVPGKVENLTATQAKQLLASVLDFERRSPTVLYSLAVPPKIKEAIQKHEIIVGMDRDAVLSAKGPPDRKVREVREGNEQEDWIYGFPPHVLYVTFDGDNVASVRQY